MASNTTDDSTGDGSSADGDRSNGGSEADESALSRLLAPITNRSYIVKMGLGGLALLVVVAAIGGVILLETESVLGDQTEAEFESQSATQAEQASTWADSLERQTTLLRKSYDRESSSTPPGEYFAEEHRTLPTEVAAIHYVEHGDAGATIVATTSDGMDETDSTDAPWRSVDPTALGDRSRMTGTYDSDVTGETAVAFVAPSDDAQTVVVVVNLRQAADRLEAPQNGRSMIVDHDGTIVLSTNPREVGANALERGYLDDEAVSLAMQDRSSYNTPRYTEHLSVDGSAQVTGLTHLSGHDLFAVSQAPRSSAYSLQTTIRNLVLGLVGAVMIGGLLVVGTLGYTTVRDLRTLSSKAEKVSSGEFDVPLATSRGDEIGQAYASVDRMRNSLQERIQEARAAAQTAEAAERRQAKLNERLTSSVEAYSEGMERAAAGDLTVRLDEDTEIDQLNDLAADFNEMMDALERSVREAKQFSDVVAATSRKTDQAFSDIREASNEITMAMQTISKGAADQNDQLETTLSEMNQLAASTEEVASSLSNIADISEQTADLGREGVEDAQAAVADMERVDEESERAVAAMEELGDRLAEIEDITGYISEVAEQTNMLALNANIEASRASSGTGDSDGFAVVANEVKELSEQTQEATQEIEDLIDAVQEQADRTADEVRTTRDVITRSTETVDRTVDSLDRIADYAERTNDGIQDIDRATENQAESAEEVVTIVQKASDISEKTAREAEDVSAAAEEQTVTVEDVDDSVGTLAEQVENLHAMLEQFEVGDRAPGADDDGVIVADAGDD